MGYVWIFLEQLIVLLNFFQLLGHCLIVARKVAAQKGIDQNGYRVVINTGPHGCQSVYHIHFHVMGGRKFKFTLG